MKLASPSKSLGQTISAPWMPAIWRTVRNIFNAKRNDKHYREFPVPGLKKVLQTGIAHTLKLEARFTNKSDTSRRVRVLYRHDYMHFSNFAKYLPKHFDGSLEEYVRQTETQI